MCGGRVWLSAPPPRPLRVHALTLLLLLVLLVRAATLFRGPVVFLANVHVARAIVVDDKVAWKVERGGTRM